MCPVCGSIPELAALRRGSFPVTPGPPIDAGSTRDGGNRVHEGYSRQDRECRPRSFPQREAAGCEFARADVEENPPKIASSGASMAEDTATDSPPACRAAEPPR